MKTEKVKIEIWSDLVCPYCYIGKKKLHQTIRKLNAADKVEIIWHSFQLDPYFPKDTSVSTSQYLSEKKGITESRLQAMYQQLTNRGRQYGINFQFDKALTFNTFDAHRLWQWSKTYDKGSEMKEVLFKAHFTGGVDLSRKENLLNVPESIGLDRAEAERILDSDGYAQAVKDDAYQARLLGLRGVPYFLINEETVIPGAQDDKIFEQVLSNALAA